MRALASLQAEEMYLDVLRILNPSELEASLCTLGLTLGARKKIARALQSEPVARE